MKHLGLMFFIFFIFFSLFATGCSAAKCVPSGDLDGDVIYEQFQTGVLNVPVPVIQYGDEAGASCSVNLNRAFRAYAVSLIDNVVCQAIDAGFRLANCIKKASHEVIEATKYKNQEDGQEANANGGLQKLTKLLDTVLELEPGNREIYNSLPALPHQPVEYRYRNTKLSLRELFLKSDEVIEGNTRKGYGFMRTAFLGGWRNARLGFNDVLRKIRNEILNNEILVAARASVDQIYDRKVVVQECVLPETWKYFEKASYRIITISNDYNSTQNGGDGCSSCTDCPYCLN